MIRKFMEQSGSAKTPVEILQFFGVVSVELRWNIFALKLKGPRHKI
jgi:hypothetical protein